MSGDAEDKRRGVSRMSVLIPTWRRPEFLLRCLEALSRQTVPAQQVVVTVRRDDAVTWAAMPQFTAALGTSLLVVTVEPGPLTAAMNAGLAQTTGELVALTDDDAEPWADWLERLSEYFKEVNLVGVGGRDWETERTPEKPRVGVISWFGRVTGEHHLGCGPARDVDVLKGVNCCFCGDVLREIGFDMRLRGRGNVTHWELSLCLSLRRAGWRLIYDPAIGVEHKRAERHDGDTNARGCFERSGCIDLVHNGTVVVLEHLRPLNRMAYLIWCTLIGTKEAVGLLQIPRLMVTKGQTFSELLPRLSASLVGHWKGFASWISSSGKQRHVEPVAGRSRGAIVKSI